MGVTVAMDDFGLSYSSLNLLQNFPFTRVKIDRSFVHGIGINAKSIVSIRSIIALYRSLGLPVTAEGVETEHQRQVLCEEDCSELQGFLFDAALPIAQVEQAKALSDLLKNARVLLEMDIAFVSEFRAAAVSSAMSTPSRARCPGSRWASPTRWKTPIASAWSTEGFPWRSPTRRRWPQRTNWP